MDVTDQVHIRRQLEAVQEQQSQLMYEISSTNKRLSDVNKELLDANEELQVANEELMLTHEELQASIEEFETTNEELQATNEELETTNEELRARTNEFQELTTPMESERVRLAEMVELAPFDILILRGSSLIVEAYNPRYAQHLEGRTVQHRPFKEVLDLFWEDIVGRQIMQLAQEAYIKNSILTLAHVSSLPPVIDIPIDNTASSRPEEQHSTYTIVPSHNVIGHVDGIIIYAVDETEQRSLEIQTESQQFTGNR